jgi:low affinity Fe/Cu permease
MQNIFRRIANYISYLTGTSWAFITALAIIIVWGISGPYFHYSDTWQLVINTGTTIVTFLMVFLIQNTQNRESKATQIKLDELLRGVKGARTGMVNAEELTDEELEKLQEEFRTMHERYSLELTRRRKRKKKK